ncbi:hypothetical protein DEO72_LG3g952 [Vigna unguiculata]|uniref:Uncharacterized protein n=1 Tax=Vigna unguiculata TaxID=3917 RepID=A0A4D6LD56_VIGUN|nr:hypothetical protein DEO72_LG3g952 [Vigna unguiculata]
MTARCRGAIVLLQRERRGCCDAKQICVTTSMVTFCCWCDAKMKVLLLVHYRCVEVCWSRGAAFTSFPQICVPLVQSRGVAGERGRWCRWFGGLQCENGGGFHSGLQRGANFVAAMAVVSVCRCRNQWLRFPARRDGGPRLTMWLRR